MSWYGVPVFRVRDGRRESPWEEMFDSLEEASAHLRAKADPELVAFECGDDGEPSGIMIGWNPEQVDFLRNKVVPGPPVALAKLAEHPPCEDCPIGGREGDGPRCPRAALCDWECAHEAYDG